MSADKLNQHQERRLSVLQRAGIFGTAAMTAMFGAACGDKAEAKPEVTPTPTVSAPETPGPIETESPTEAPTETIEPTDPGTPDTEKTREERVAELEISAELGPEQLGEAFADRLSQWSMAGTGDDELWEETYGDFTKTRGEYKTRYAEVAAEQAEVFAEALFVEDWQRRPSLISVKEDLTAFNAQGMDQFYLNENWDNKPSYTEYHESTGVTVVETPAGDELGLTINLTQHNNGDEVELDVYKAADVNGSEYSLDVVFVEEDGSWKIRRYGFMSEILLDK